jgi:hypothetical protein
MQPDKNPLDNNVVSPNQPGGTGDLPALMPAPPRRHTGLFIALAITVLICLAAIAVAFAELPKHIKSGASKRPVAVQPLKLTTYQDSVVSFAYPATFVRGETNPYSLRDFQYTPVNSKDPAYEGLNIQDLSNLPGATRTLPSSLNEDEIQELSGLTGTEDIYDGHLTRTTFAGVDGVKITGKYKRQDDKVEVYFERVQSYPGNMDVQLDLKAATNDQAYIKQFDRITNSVKLYKS